MEKKKLGKESGRVDVVIGVFVITLLMVVITAHLQMEQFEVTKTYMEDALAASNLASAVVDIEEYGITNDIIISDTANAYATYKEAIRFNLNLDDAWECPNKALISGPVTVLNYTIYNVRKTDVEIYSYDENGVMNYQLVSGGLGSVTSPDGVVISSTSIYSQIGFPIEAVWGIKIDAVQDNTADIVKQN